MCKEVTITDRDVIDVIRSDERIGSGTCSMIDECFTDDELVCVYREEQYGDLESFLEYLLAVHAGYLERLEETFSWE